MTLTHHEQPDWPPVCTYQQGGRGKGQTWVLHAAVGERWRENQDIILTPNIRSSQFLSCLQHGFGLKDKEHPNITPASLCPACSTFFCVLMLYMFVCFTCSHIFMFVCSHVLCVSFPLFAWPQCVCGSHLGELKRCFVHKLFLRPDSGPWPDLPANQSEHRVKFTC